MGNPSTHATLHSKQGASYKLRMWGLCLQTTSEREVLDGWGTGRVGGGWRGRGTASGRKWTVSAACEPWTKLSQKRTVETKEENTGVEGGTAGEGNRKGGGGEEQEGESTNLQSKYLEDDEHRVEVNFANPLRKSHVVAAKRSAAKGAK